MIPDLTIGTRELGKAHPALIVAELSANHGGVLTRALEMVHAAKEAGADAIKLQTYTADTLTLKSRAPQFRVGAGTPWAGKSLHELYQEAYTPWEWHPVLFAEAKKLGLICFSTPFDPTAVEFLEELETPAYKIASFELVDLPLIQQVAETGKPVILSTGMASHQEIADAIRTVRSVGNHQIVALKCTSAYPAKPETCNLQTMVHLGESFGVLSGLSDHTLGTAVPTAAAALGAKVIEKHFTLNRDANSPDSSFSLEPHEFAEMVQAVRETEAAIGTVCYGPSQAEAESMHFRRSLYVVEDIFPGETFNERNVRSIRPSDGLPPKHLPDILGQLASGYIPKGTPLAWEHVFGFSRVQNRVA